MTFRVSSSCCECSSCFLNSSRSSTMPLRFSNCSIAAIANFLCCKYSSCLSYEYAMIYWNKMYTYYSVRKKIKLLKLRANRCVDRWFGFNTNRYKGINTASRTLSVYKKKNGNYWQNKATKILLNEMKQSRSKTRHPMTMLQMWKGQQQRKRMSTRQSIS